MNKAIVILCIILLASAATATTCPTRYQILDNGGKAWLGLNVSGFVAGEGQTIVLDCDGRLETVYFKLVLDGEIWNDAFPLASATLTATLRLPESAFALASADAIIDFDMGSEWIAFDFSGQEIDLEAGEYLMTCHPVGFRQGRLAYAQGEDVYPLGVRYVSEGGGDGPWIAISAEFGDLALKVEVEEPVPSDAVSWSEIKALFQ